MLIRNKGPYVTHKFPTLAQELSRLVPVNALCAKALLYARLGHDLTRVLPPALQAKTRFACVRDRTLVFLVASPTWAAKLRLHAHQLVSVAQRCHALDVDHCAVRIQRADADSPQPRR